MLDIREIRQDPEKLRTALRNRGEEQSVVDEVVELDRKRRAVLQELEQLRAESNAVSKQISALQKSGQDASELIAKMRGVRARIKELEAEERKHGERLTELLLRIPNIPHESVPVGEDESANVKVREWGERRELDFEPKPHWVLGPELGILDLETSSKLAGARFNVFVGEGAALERALINFMLDLHVNEHGYTEISPPFLANRQTMQGTGQVPILEEDMFKVEQSDLYLIPTAEVPLTTLHADEILEPGTLPRYYTAYTPCFRREAGAAGKETRGLIRRHQFDKVELVIYSEPERSFDALEKLTADAEDVLKRLGLHFRTMLLCTGDMGAASAKTYDIEVWMPGMGRYVEISSCSNCTDYQARRAKIRFRRQPKAKPELCHTLNGSGVAVGRTFAAVIENYQESDGSVVIPEVLRPYMGGKERIAPPG